MSATVWQRYRLSWRLASPLHIGYRTIGTIARTRLWVPGRNVWGALIDTLARAQGATPQHPELFKAMQDAFAESLRFEAWFLGSSPQAACMPHYSEKGLCYGAFSEREMQRLVLSANVSTAIDHGATIAEEGMLFETEYIAPTLLQGSPAHANTPPWKKGTPLWLVGHIWAKADAPITINGQSLEITALTNHYLKELSIGGEQKSGYGRLVAGQITPTDISQQSDQPHLDIDQETPFPFLVIHEKGQSIRGQIEPIVGRTTDTKKKPGHGANLDHAQFCWLPGSMHQEAQPLHMFIESLGIARKIVKPS